MEEPHILKESLLVLKEQLGISFEMLADKLCVKPSLLAEISGIDYIQDQSDDFENVVFPLNSKKEWRKSPFFLKEKINPQHNRLKCYAILHQSMAKNKK